MADRAKLEALDTLDHAVAMLQFLTDVTPALAHDSSIGGISETGSFGLCLILEHVSNTINQARELI